MDSIVITLSNTGRRADLELPAEIPIGLLLPPLFIRLGWIDDPLQPHGSLLLTGTIQTTGRSITGRDTLASAGVRTGDLLDIHFPMPAAPQPEMIVDVKEPSLVSETGQVFPIRSRSIIIGRPDPGRRPPDIDLTSFDKKTVTSRRHAQIWLDQHNTYWIKDLHSTNGLLLNGRQLSPGERARLENGLEIQFGADGPKMTYHT